jgi:peptidyl-prolyl cis-trans isomerase SurA
MKYIYTIVLILWSNIALSSQVLVIVDGNAITSVDVDKRLAALKIANPEIIGDESFNRHILSNLISEELFHNEAKRLKISISKEEIDDHFKDMQREHNFSPSLATRLIQNESLRMQVESQLLWSKLVGIVLYSKIKVSDAEIREEQKVQKREIREITFKQIVSNHLTLPKITKIQEEAKDCTSLDKIAKQYSLPTPYKNNLLFSDLNQELQSILRALPENELSDMITIQDQQQVIMVCKKNILNKSQDIQTIRKELTSSKINAEAQKYLAELKKRVYIEYMK